MGFNGGVTPARFAFSSDVQPSAVLPAVAANVALPSVTIPAGVLQGRITRVVAGVSWRKQVDSSGVANAVNGAQTIQVRSDAPGTFRNAVNIADGALSTAASGTEGGSMLIGDNDIKVEVTGADTYEFQWTNAAVDGASLTLHDVQTFLFVETV